MTNKILTRTILLVSFISLFTDVASEMLYPVMPIYLKSIGFSFALIGLLEGLAEATAGLSKGYFGNLSDSIGKRAPFVRAGYTLGAISKPMMALFVYPLWIFFARTIDRLGKGMRTGARDAILSDETAPENKGRVFGFHRSMDTLGAAIGPALALLYLWFRPGEYRLLFFIAFIPGLIAISLSSFLKDKKKTEQKEKKHVGFFSYFGYWKRATPEFRRLVAGLLLFTLLNSSDIFLLLYVRTRLTEVYLTDPKLADIWMIGIYIFFNLIYALFSYPLGIIADRIGLKVMLVIGLLIFSVVYILIGFASSVPVFAGIFLLYGLYYAASEGVSKALISNIAKKEETATAIGFYTGFASICSLLASSLAGLIWGLFGATVLFLGSGIGVFCIAIFLNFAVPKTAGNGNSGRK
jgi:MFS family permease